MRSPSVTAPPRARRVLVEAYSDGGIGVRVAPTIPMGRFVLTAAAARRGARDASAASGGGAGR